MNRLGLFVARAVLALILAACAATQDKMTGSKSRHAEPPGILVAEMIGRGLSALKEPPLLSEGERLKRWQRLWGEIEPIFDFEEMSRLTLGHFWEMRTPEERKELVRLCTIALKWAYVEKTHPYTTKKVNVVGEKMDKEDFARVRAIISSLHGSHVAVEYRMMRRREQWKVYDVIIDGAGLVDNFERNFAGMLAGSTYDRFVLEMKDIEKQFELEMNK